jgi:O-antigen/teichoic acid export membrane protein
MASELHSTGKIEELKSIFMKASRLSAAITLMIFTLLLIYGDIFLTLWVGDAIASQLKYSFPLLISAGLISQLSSGLLNFIVVGIGKLRLFNAYTIIKALVLLMGLIIFIHLWGLTGAGVGFLLLSLIDCGYLILFLRKIMKTPFHELFRFSYMASLINSAIMCLIGLVIRPVISGWLTLFISCAFLSIVYFVGAYLLKIFGDTEKRVVMTLFYRLAKPLKGMF